MLIQAFKAAGGSTCAVTRDDDTGEIVVLQGVTIRQGKISGGEEVARCADTKQNGVTLINPAIHRLRSETPPDDPKPPRRKRSRSR